MKKLLDQVIALTKNIHLRNPGDGNYGMEQFFAGKRDSFMLGGGFGISWWYTKTTFKLVENISFIITNELEEFAECDHKTIQDIVRSTLHEICMDEKVFRGDDVFFSRKSSLFECRKDGDITEYAQYILNFFLSNIRSAISDWCVIYTVPRLVGESFSVDSEEINVVNKRDQHTWKSLEEQGYLLRELNQESGSFSDGRTTAFTNQTYDYYLIARVYGTQQGSKFTSSLKLRKLLSVIYSITSGSSRTKVAAKPYSVSLQIPNKSSGISTIAMSEIGELLPYYANDNVLGEREVKEILNWYTLEAGLPAEQKNRISKCAHFINKGMNTDDIDSYIHYFVALDALFGRRGAVEDSIKCGVSLLPQAGHWEEKISWLFDLRNELVHGGSRFIQEWSKYMKYYRHFSTEPSNDMEQLAFLALRSSPSIFKNESNDSLRWNATAPAD
ncbi:HEPN domain-containing protein [Microbulbifer rhizosphaerae]|uniref:Apea-like HEPN domain-containing protein n=1 Tax=Microbulbifer rhizosphaerae TaxID=1562603 RepID=A0A7W4WGD3_9GAMM|nr:HEPN domain-containing protein [Microbulbifer rhizosphaerae]MBB3063292.1 hypothetical protein [Microbulbifer rhizosphaerae]